MPFQKHKYPADWPTISMAIRARSDGQCECAGECGLHHAHRCEERNGQKAKWAKGTIVLTVAHLDNPDGMDCRDENLKAMCQRCHLRYDVALHVAHRRANAKAKRSSGDLFTEEAR